MFTEVALTGKQKQQWSETMSMMMWSCPGWRHLWYKLLAEKSNAGNGEYVGIMTADIDNACTDGKNVIFNPDWYFKLTIPERVFVAAHEVVHNVYHDVEFLHQCVKSGLVPMNDGTTLPFDMATMQKCMDYRINAMLIEARIGRPPKQGNFDAKTSPNDSVIEVYKRHYKKPPEQGDGGGNPSGFDNLLPPGSSMGKDPDTAAAERNDGQWAVEVAVAQQLENERTQGRMPLGMKRLFAEILEPEVYWLDHLTTEFSRRVGSGSKTWKRPNRRFIGRDLYLPSPSGYGAGWIAEAGDTSGSIGRAELDSFLGETRGIVEAAQPQRLTIAWCDGAIASVDEVEDVSDLEHIKCRGVGGGGGTDFRPVFDWIAEQDERPEVLIYFTDGYGTFPNHEPPYPVIWCSTTDAKYPWGTVVRIRKGKYHGLAKKTARVWLI